MAKDKEKNLVSFLRTPHGIFGDLCCTLAPLSNTVHSKYVYINYWYLSFLKNNMQQITKEYAQSQLEAEEVEVEYLE